SCDWSREKFTLDQDIIKKTQEAFAEFYKKGLIYRGARIVNWCPKHQTALADLETKYVEKKDPLYYFKYGPFEIATARPETKFGDKYVVMYPKDKRYTQYKDGQKIELEWINGPITATIIKDEAIDMAFGTGVMTITPWHDPADFEIAERHHLDKEQVIDRYGKLMPIAGEFAEMKIADARLKIAEKLKAKGLLTRIEEGYDHKIAVCYKCQTPIEPQILPQWFLKMKPLAARAIEAVENGKITFIPARFKKVYFHWLKNIRDWNLSQQITWGIRIPAWFCVGCGDVRMNPAIKGNWFFVRHGETDWNIEKRMQGHAPTSLNERGREQAHDAVAQFKSKNIDLVISSDLPRAKETAEIIGRELGVEVIFDARLRERNYGQLEGMTAQELERQGFQHKLKQPDFKPQSGESLEELERRVYEAITHHKDRHSHKNIVIVSHGTALLRLLQKLKNLGDAWMENLKLGNANALHFSIVKDLCKKCGSDFAEQDPDVLTTWFSSGQWPFLALGFPDSRDYKTFYPTDVMETGWDILFFWVARMIMLGLYRTKKIPFKTVYLHGLVRDKDRQKMSKSKGNVIDPLGVAELYGTDAVRMALVIGNLPGNDVIISEEKIRGYRNFANKIWNASRFVLMHTGSLSSKNKIKYTKEESEMRKKLQDLVKKTTSDMEQFKFHHAADRLYHFFWHYYADKVIEAMKPKLTFHDGTAEKETARALLLEFHTTLLKLLHPFMPFITEEVWSKLPTGKKSLLMIEPWPNV
ncbi:MAG: Valine--tRNA ligase, partial [Parcubacteria group bacterium Gr01-1014_33]